MQGWSVYGAPGGPLHDGLADAAFVDSLTRNLRREIAIHKLPLHINAPAFADHCCELLLGFLGMRTSLCANPSKVRSEIGSDIGEHNTICQGTMPAVSGGFRFPKE
jgi:hypothetical protein